jgi:hypothetical protein
MTSPVGGPRPRRARWWSSLLVVHAALVVVVLVAAPLLPATSSGAVDGLRLVLGAPWWLLASLVLLPLPVPEGLALWLAHALPVVANLALHAVLLQVAARAEAQRDCGELPPVRERPASRSAQAGLSVLAGALVWAAWLGWDRTASFDVVTGTVQSPYVTLQVVGCALTVGVVTGVLAARWSPSVAAAGVSVGFLACWTVDAASQDDSGLFVIGAVLLAVGLAAGTALSAAVGHLVGLLLQRRRQELV